MEIDSPCREDAMGMPSSSSSKEAHKRSTREKKPVVREDLGYIDKEKSKITKTL